jgi:hypothetical protein
VQEVERDRLRPQPPKALLDLSPEHVGPAVAGAPAAFGRDNDTVGNRRQRGADGLFALAACVRVCGVDVPEACGDCLLRERDVLARVRESIRPKADPRHLGVAQPQVRRIHPEQDYAARRPPSRRARNPGRRAPGTRRFRTPGCPSWRTRPHRSRTEAAADQSEIVVPTALCTNASGKRPARRCTALQPVQCAGINSSGWRSSKAATVGSMMGSNIGPLR